MALLFAATHPDNVSHVITFGGYAKSCAAPDFPHMPSHEQRVKAVDSWIDNWGKGIPLGIFVPELHDNQAARRLFGRIERASMSPSAMRRYFDMNLEIDIRDVLPAVRVPVLVMQHEDDRQVPFANSGYLAEHLPNARLVNCGSGGHYYWSGDNAAIVAEVRDFLAATKSGAPAGNRVLATILFTDIVGSTQTLSNVGDAAWRSVLDRHDSLSRDFVELHRGKVIRSTGDGVLATFDSPGRAVECACRLTEEVRHLSIQLRAGLHTGEIDIRGQSIDGIAVHAAARIEACASANQVVVSQAVTDLMVGSPIAEFTALGSRELKGLPGQWPLYAANA
jgi:class 3 adenylate cyclase